jgi:hypothetical protein
MNDIAVLTSLEMTKKKLHVDEDKRDDEGSKTPPLWIK